MSLPIDPTHPAPRDGASGTQHELRRRGHVLGIQYDLGLRISALSDAGLDSPRPPLLRDASRRALSEPGRSTDGSAAAAPTGRDVEGGK